MAKLTALQQFQALPASTQQVIALETIEYLLALAESEDASGDADTAYEAVELGLGHIAYDAPPRFSLLTDSAHQQALAFVESARETCDEARYPR